MSATAKIFMSGRSQAIRLPKEFRFEGTEVFIRRDPLTGDIILSRKPESWEGLFALDEKTDVPDGFMSKEDRQETEHTRDPFEGWEE